MLLRHPTDKAVGEKQTRPILVTGRCGRGLTMFVGTDEFWRWRFAQGDRYFYRFYAQADDGIRAYVDGRAVLNEWHSATGRVYTFDLSLDGARQATLPDFTGARGRGAYPDLEVDSLKALAGLHGRLPYIDVLEPGAADTVLGFVSFSGDTFAGRPVGMRERCTRIRSCGSISPRPTYTVKPNSCGSVTTGRFRIRL